MLSPSPRTAGGLLASGAFSTGQLQPANTLFLQPFKTSQKNKESNFFFPDRFLADTVPSVHHQAFVPVFCTQGNDLAKFEKPWSSIRKPTVGAAQAVSQLIPAQQVPSQKISTAERHRVKHTPDFHTASNAQAYVQSSVDRGDWNRGILFLGTVSDLYHLE